MKEVEEFSISTKVRIDAIAFDAGTQIRAAINEQVVADYAERMSEGVVFPPIVLFHDGNAHYLADGFHRYMASKRVGFTDIVADVQPGTKEDALWFALGANKANGQRLTVADKRHAIELAITTWPERSMNQIAEQLGCARRYVQDIKSKVATTSHLPASVIGRDGKEYPARQNEKSEKTLAVEQMIRDGASSSEIVAKLKAHPGTVATARRALGVSTLDNSRAAVKNRRDKLREMAASGHTSRQISAATGISDQHVRDLARREGIDVHADRAVGKTRRHDSNRIMDRIVMDAENLNEGVNLIEFADLDGDRFGDWIDSLMASKLTIDTLIKRLLKERKRHGEAA